MTMAPLVILITTGGTIVARPSSRTGQLEPVVEIGSETHALPAWKALAPHTSAPQIHAARDVVREHKTQLSPFASPEFGCLGRVDDDRFCIQRRPCQRWTCTADRLETNVDLIKLVAGSDSRFLHASIAAASKGIVVERFPGTRMLCAEARDGLVRAREQGITVVLCARSLKGRIRPWYGVRIGAASLLELGVILGRDLSAFKARLLLMLLLTRAQGDAELTRLFAEASP